MDLEARGNHLRVAAANRDLYDSCRDEIEDFDKYTSAPLTRSYIRKNIQQAVDRLAGAGHDLRFLDVGTGSGHLIDHLRRFTAAENVHAVDISRENIESARKRFPGVQLHLGDFILDFETAEQFDLITSYSVLHHFFDWRLFLEKADRLLKGGGIIYIDHEPMDSLINNFCALGRRIKNRHRKEFVVAEYHLYRDAIDPLALAGFMRQLGYETDISFINVPLAGSFLKYFVFNPIPSAATELLISKDYQKSLKQLFVSYNLIARKPRRL